jgi:hypothetical protein
MTIFKKYELIILSLIVGCSTNEEKVQHPPYPGSHLEQRMNDFGKLFGDDALTFHPLGELSNQDQNNDDDHRPNPYLWGAALESISFMPLQQASNGVILTDWHEATPGTRFKIAIYINEKNIKSSSFAIKTWKENKIKDVWVAAPCSDAFKDQLKRHILQKAYNMRDKNKH